jgi:hypothetical protein
MRYTGDSFEVGFTRAVALPARPGHFRVKHRIHDARAGRSRLSGVFWVVVCARGRVRALRVRNVFVLSILHWRGARGAPRGAGSLGRELFCKCRKNKLKTASRRDEPAIARSIDVSVGRVQGGRSMG